MRTVLVRAAGAVSAARHPPRTRLAEQAFGGPDGPGIEGAVETR